MSNRKLEMEQTDELVKSSVSDAAKHGYQMTSTWRQTYHLAIILTIVVVMLTGCTSILERLDDRMNRQQFKSDYESLEEALELYDKGDFPHALARFKALSKTSASNKISRKAWLGEICCLLMLADTPAEYTTAIGKWHDFGKSVSLKDSVWDWVLFDPLVVRMTPKTHTRVVEIYPPAAQVPMEAEAPAAQVPPETETPEIKKLQAQLANLKKELEQVDELQHRMDKVNAENRSLREKISAIEAIDQNIQKKKTEIATPNE